MRQFWRFVQCLLNRQLHTLYPHRFCEQTSYHSAALDSLSLHFNKLLPQKLHLCTMKSKFLSYKCLINEYINMYKDMHTDMAQGIYIRIFQPTISSASTVNPPQSFSAPSEPPSRYEVLGWTANTSCVEIHRRYSNKKRTWQHYWLSKIIENNLVYIIHRYPYE